MKFNLFYFIVPIYSSPTSTQITQHKPQISYKIDTPGPGQNTEGGAF